MLELEGCSLFRHYIVCSLLSKKAIRISNIHADEDPMGVNVYEANFLKFIDRITSGSSLQCTNYNTVLTFYPGVILGGCFTHEVPPERCVSYIIEAAVLLLPFAKYNSKITFVGCTQSELDLSVDTIRTVTTRWLQLFGVDVHVRVIRRGAPPGGGGMVELTVNAIRRLSSACATERGRVRRIRGIAFASRTAADLPQRVATTAKGVLLNIIPDVYIVCDIEGGNDNKNENISGYGVVLVAETTSKLCVLSQESVAMSQELSESVGTRAANLLLDQIYSGGCVDSHHEMLVLLLMALSPDEVSTVRFGQLSPSGLSAVLLMDTFFAVKCAIKEEKSFAGEEYPHSVLITCLGSNLVNVWKKSS